jgi:hypothetical protein
LTYLREKGPGLQLSLNKKGDYISTVLNTEIKKRQLPFFIANYGSLWKVKFHEDVPYSELMFTLMREKGIHILDGFPCFITEAMSDQDLESIIRCFTESMDEMIAGGFFNRSEQGSASVERHSPVLDSSNPPVQGARLGKDANGNPAWFVEDKKNKGSFLQVQQTIN